MATEETSALITNTATDMNALLAEIASKVKGRITFSNTVNVETDPIVVKVNGENELKQPFAKGLICNTYDLGYEFPKVFTPEEVLWIAQEYDIKPDAVLGGGVLEDCTYEMSEKGVTDKPAQYYESGELRYPEQRTAFYSGDRPANQWVGDYGSVPPWVK